MPRREFGLMGYIGESVVELWLRRTYPPPCYDVISQIRPQGLPAAGGPYLDFGVLERNNVRAVYEVKCQDYIFEGGVNDALQYIWARNGQELEFVLGDGRRFQGTPSTEAFLVLLVPPNSKGLLDIGQRNLANVRLFSEILQQLGRLQVDDLLPGMREHITAVFAVLDRPTQGQTLLAPFQRARTAATEAVAARRDM